MYASIEEAFTPLPRGMEDGFGIRTRRDFNNLFFLDATATADKRGSFFTLTVRI
jgi:hypothetical protein